MDVFAELAAKLRDLASSEAHRAARPPLRFRVVSVDPLACEQLDGPLVLEEGDPDVEWAKQLVTDPPAVGDVVRVHRDAHDDFIVGGVIV